MKKIFFPLFAAILAAWLAFPPSAPALAAEVETLHVCSWEEYANEDLFLNEQGEVALDEEDPESLRVQNFVTWYKANYGKDVNIEYTTKGTCEDMYNDVLIAKAAGNRTPYDLICPSDYMIQKMIREDMLEPINYEKIPNYAAYASNYIKSVYEDKANAVNGKRLSEYAVGYMWGTMGLFYNADNVALSDMQTWMAVFNVLYDNRITIKDSVRDTYFLGLAVVYRDELNAWGDKYESGECTLAEYRAALSEICNRTDDESLTKVAETLAYVKKIMFGFELDNGKNDMLAGKIDLNFAWSGDAACYINEANEEGGRLAYAVPREGSNVWFDGWVMPKGANTELAEAFINYMCLPEVAVMNMDAVGYTSVVSGNAENSTMLDYIRDWYMDEEGDIEVDLSYFFGDIPEARFTTNEDSYRPLYAQYSDEETINRCVMMVDFGDRTAQLNNMWSKVKSGSFPTLIVLLSIVGAAALGGIIYLIVYFAKRHLPKGAVMIRRG